MMISQMPFTYSADELDVLTTYLSAERLAMYMKAVRFATDLTDRKRKAVRRYEYNTSLAEALYPVLQGFEVALRNTIHNRLTVDHGEAWLETFDLRESERESVAEAKRTILEKPQPLTQDRLVAGLTFGFWVRLFSADYADTLWGPSLSKIAALKDRRALYDRLIEIKTLRNRIAHHDRILGRTYTVEQSYERVLEALDWFSPVVCAWVMGTNSVMEKLAGKKPVVAPGSRGGA